MQGDYLATKLSQGTKVLSLERVVTVADTWAKNFPSLNGGTAAEHGNDTHRQIINWLTIGGFQTELKYEVIRTKVHHRTEYFNVNTNKANIPQILMTKLKQIMGYIQVFLTNFKCLK